MAAAADNDNLDAFFDEVEEVEKDSINKIESVNQTSDHPSNCEPEAGGDRGETQPQERPFKKARTALPDCTTVGRGAVVVAKKATVTASSTAYPNIIK